MVFVITGSIKVQVYFLSRHWFGSSLQFKPEFIPLKSPGVLSLDNTIHLYGLDLTTHMYGEFMVFAVDHLSDFPFCVLEYMDTIWCFHVNDSKPPQTQHVNVSKGLPPHSWGVPGKIHLFLFIFGFCELWGKISFRKMFISSFIFWLSTYPMAKGSSKIS